MKEQIYHNLLLQFTTMSFGQRVVERDLTDMLGVSRTPVREALTRLVLEGFLESTGRGYRIPTVEAADIDDLTEIRTLLEPVAARQGAQNPKDTGLEAMSDALADARQAHSNNDPLAFNAANRAFRAAWRKRVKNTLLLDSPAKAMSSLQLLRHRAMQDAHARESILSSDQELLEAFKSRDAERAAASRHMQIQEIALVLKDHLPSG